MNFCLEDFEHAAYTRQHEVAARMLLDLLSILNNNNGVPGAHFKASPLAEIGLDERETHIGVRVASAISCLFSDREFQFAPQSLTALFTLQRWFAAIFASTPFLNADHIVRALNVSGKGDLTNVQVAPGDLAKFCLLFFPDSEINLNIDALWAANPDLAVSLALALLSPRFMGSASAHRKRELLLPWLTQKLLLVDSLERLPFGILHDVYMCCSYADRADKHDIKRSMNVLFRRWLDAKGFKPVITEAKASDSTGVKPLMLVCTEWFHGSHSIYRTHSLSLEAARNYFHVVGMGLAAATDDVGRAVFDEWIEIKGPSLEEQLHQVRQVAEQRRPSVFYMPSVGMFPMTLFLCNLRLAPLMVTALGHPATTHSDVVDYVVVESDYVGDPACFSERLLQTPPDGIPYRPSLALHDVSKPILIRESPPETRIAVAASVIKFNPRFLTACRRILERSPVPLEFHFTVGGASGLLLEQLKRTVSRYLGDRAVVHGHQPYADYFETLRQCDMYINPFPFGNTNGLIDTTLAGLVGVCKTGPEVLEHIDEGLFHRLGFPEWLIAKTEDEYVEAAVRLAGDSRLRNQLRRELSGSGKVDAIYHGNSRFLGETLRQMVSGG